MRGYSEMNYLQDQVFLQNLDEHRNKIIYAKIISLTKDEFPQEEITGKVTSGSINIDGTSAVRRTCSLSLIAKDVKLNSFYWGLQTKFKLFIGVENHIDTKYPDIIWFPQGIFVITNFSSSQSINSYNISLQGKDKMCLLNGDLSGALTAISQQFDLDYQTQPDDSLISYKVPIYTIIYKLVNQLGGEKNTNIIIKDLDDYGLELLDYSADIPLYMILNENNDVYQVYIDGNVEIWLQNGKKKKLIELNTTNFNFNNLLSTGFINKTEPTKVKISSTGKAEYTIAKKEKGEAVGYSLTDITYAGDLIATAGETITSVLDKIKNQLGDFEYFYDVEGNFIFQRAQDSFNIAWSPIQKISNFDIRLLLQERGLTSDEIKDILNGNFSKLDAEQLDLTDKEIKQIKETVTEKNTSITKEQYVLPKNYTSEFSYNFEGNKLVSSMNNSPNLLNIKNDYKIWGIRKTTAGSEINIHLRYAIDKKPQKYKSYDGKVYKTGDKYQENKTKNEIVCDWREIIYQMSQDYFQNHRKEDFFTVISNYNPEFLLGVTGYEAYYEDLDAFWRQLYNPSPSDDEKESFYDKDSDHFCWNKNIEIDPGQLNFWFDFLETSGELEKFSVQSIGRRVKVISDKDVKSIYFKKVPLAIFYTKETDRNLKPGYSYFKMGQGTEQYFNRSSQGKSAQEVLNNLLYQHTNAQETITLNVIPIYYLNPNTKIYIKDEQNLDINGKYSISRLTIPLTYNGLMNITATKVIDRLM